MSNLRIIKILNLNEPDINKQWVIKPMSDVKKGMHFIVDDIPNSIFIADEDAYLNDEGIWSVTCQTGEIKGETA